MKEMEFGTVRLAGGISCRYCVYDDKSVLICGYGKENGKYIPAVPKETAGHLVLPNFIGKRIVSGIAAHAFDGCANIWEIDIPAGVLVIGSGAFSGCTSLRTVNVSEKLKDDRGFFAKLGGKKIGEFETGLRIVRDHAFSSCSALAKINFPSTLVKIGFYAFVGCKQLGVPRLPASLCDMAGDAFENDVIRYATFPSGLTALVQLPLSHEYRIAKSGAEILELKDSEVLEQHSLLEDDEQPKQRLQFSDANGCLWRYRILFDDAARLGWDLGDDHNWGVMDDIDLTEPPENTTAILSIIERATAPNEIKGHPVTRLAMGAFRECKQLKEIALSERITAVPSGTFSGCEALCEVKLPNSVTRIGSKAFDGCRELKRMAFPANLNCIEEKAFSCAFMGKNNVELVMPESLLAIAGEAFYNAGCKHVRLNSQLRYIAPEAFAFTSIETLDIGSGLTTIESGVFPGSKLTHLTIPGNIKVIESGAFSSSNELSDVVFEGRGTLVSASAFRNCPCEKDVLKNSGIVIFPETDNIC